MPQNAPTVKEKRGVGESALAFSIYFIYIAAHDL